MKKINFYILTIFIVFFTINLCSVATIYVVTKKNYFNKNEYLSFKRKFKKSDEKTMYPHPFFGFNHTYYKPANDKVSLNEQLFFHLPSKVEKDDIKILVLGGSVAQHLSQNQTSEIFKTDNIDINGKNILQNLLNHKFKTNKFKVFNAAIGGGKQPQQLFKLYYLYLIGEKFDIVINLDGFNEIALSFSENIEIGNNIIYPRNYSRLISTFNSDLDCVQKSNKLTKNYSYLPITELYKLYKIRDCHFKSEGDPKNKKSRFSKMTNFVDLSQDTYFNYIMRLWINSSHEIESFSNEKKFTYINIIQPNQYLKGSKILSKSELSLLTYDKYGEPISKYYKNVNINDFNLKHKLDLRYIFKDNKTTLYRDYCCHLNNHGMYLIADEIINKFTDVFRSKLY